VGVGNALARLRIHEVKTVRHGFRILIVAVAALLALPVLASAQAAASKKQTWKTLEFAILRFNDQAPNSWNIYHSEKKGVLLVRLWKRYLLVRLQDEEVYDIDPEKIAVHGDTVEWSLADIPEKPIDIEEWKERNVGLVERVTFRFGKKGHVLELQLPLGPGGVPIY